MAALKLLILILVLMRLDLGVAFCSYNSCPRIQPQMINVHLVPHSHDDVGWLKTVDQYYYGSRNNIQRAGVQYILDSVITELLNDDRRRFIQVESAFFYKWFNEQTKIRQSQVKALVTAGRLEFAGGAWSMNDEAAVHYQSVIDQFTVGLEFLNETFGECGRPRVGWQIDPFGHSREMASLFAQMGFDGHFFARMDWVEKNKRLKNLAAEMIWQASESLAQSAELFTGLLFNHYSAPSGFCFDSLCNDQPIIDGDSHDNNVQQRVDEFIAYIRNMAKYYRSSHLLVPMGDDFNYENANINFKNMDKLIRYVNERQLIGSNINLFYSTPSCYLKALHNNGSLTWPTKKQDFFPYSTDYYSYWSGYFSSRPTQKRYERIGNHVLQVTKQLTVLANLNTAEARANLKKLKHVMGIMQHHDAITGTEKQHVAYDYDRLLTDGLYAAMNSSRLALQTLSDSKKAEFVMCLQLNISSCEFTQNSGHNLLVTLFNPLSWGTVQYVRIPVSNGSYVVTDSAGKLKRHQMVPVPKEVLSLRDPKTNFTQSELVFKVYVKKLEHFYINKATRPNHQAASKEVKIKRNKDTVVRNSQIALTFNKKGFLYNIRMNGVSEKITQEFYYYRGALGNNTQFKFRSSGAYIFRPHGNEVLVSPLATIRVYDGPLVKEVHQRFNDWVSQVIRIYEGKNLVEFEWLVGPIPIKDNVGKEIITRFSSNIRSNSVFYTDSNGREMLRRVRNQREYFQPNLTERVSGNYYPVTSRIALHDERVRLALLNDRAQGGSSLRDGVLELMLHRRLLHDDAFGVGEALNETVNGKGLVARGKIQLLLNSVTKKPSIQERLLEKELHLPLARFFSNSSKAVNGIPKNQIFFYLPEGVNILTLEQYGRDDYLLRLEYFFDKTEAGNVTFNIRHIFEALSAYQMCETTLDGNMQLSDMKRFKFQPDGTAAKQVEYYRAGHTPLCVTDYHNYPEFSITMQPMQIRTFIIKTKGRPFSK